MRTPAPRESGVGLIQLLTAVAIAAMLATLGVPGFQDLLQRNQVIAASNELLASVYRIRSEAILRDSRVTLCPSRDLRSCSADHLGWGEGYIGFLDSNANGKREEGDDLLLAKAGGDVRIQSNSAHRQSIGYAGTGRAWSSTISLRICGNGNPQDNRALIIAGSGRPRLSSRLPNGGQVICN